MLPWMLGAGPCRRRWSLLPMATAILVHCLVQFGDGLVAVERFGCHWLLARHLGRAALVSTHGDARSCRIAQRLAAAHSHAHLDWVMLLDPVATDVLLCWQVLAHRVEADQQVRTPIASSGAAERWFVGTTPEASRWSTGVAGGTPTLGDFLSPHALWILQELQRLASQQFYRNMAWLQASAQQER